MTIRSDTTPDREADSQQGLGFSVNVWRVPDHKPEDMNFRTVERIKKPNRDAKYFVDVVFDAPDAHIKLSRNCE